MSEMNSVQYLENVLSSWGEFCKQHSKFEEALKNVLEENKRLKEKSSLHNILSVDDFDKEIENQIVFQQILMKVTFTKAEVELIKMALARQYAYVCGGIGAGKTNIATAVKEISERMEDVWKAETPKESVESKKIYHLYEDKGLSAEDLRIAYRTITGLDNDNEFTDDEIHKYLLDSLKEDKDREEYYKKAYPKTVAYVDEHIQSTLRCDSCSSIILTGGNGTVAEGRGKAFYQCLNCDENRFADEVHVGEPCEKTERLELYSRAVELLLLD